MRGRRKGEGKGEERKEKGEERMGFCGAQRWACMRAICGRVSNVEFVNAQAQAETDRRKQRHRPFVSRA